MTTSVAFEIDYDQDISVSMVFYVEADGSPSRGWDVKLAQLSELAVWLDCDHAEEPQLVAVDKTDWFCKFVKSHGYQDQVIEKLNEKFEANRQFDAEMRTAGYWDAVRLGVD